MPYFLITIDTEGDNLWAKPRRIETRNAKYLPRFQSLCEKYNFKPTYLTNYEMAVDGRYTEFAKDVVSRGTGEVGMHLHAWNSPPLKALTSDDHLYHPYLIEYPDSIMRDKIAYMTDLLENMFNLKMISHRAGRWSMDARYARMLVERGYLVDCSVTPHVSWRDHWGDPGQSGGTDFSSFHDGAYFIDLDDMRLPGNSRFLEVPMTIFCDHSPLKNALKIPIDAVKNRYGHKKVVRRFAERVSPKTIHWLRPNGRNASKMLEIVNASVERNSDYIEFMLHSSELMPGGSPNFRDESSINKLYDDLGQLFDTIKGNFTGVTLKDYYQLVVQRRSGDGEQSPKLAGAAA